MRSVQLTVNGVSILEGIEPRIDGIAEAAQPSLHSERDTGVDDW